MKIKMVFFYTCAIPTKTSYPRYHNTKRRLEDIQQRFDDINASISGSDVADLPKHVGDAHFIILSKRPTASNYISKALFPNGDKEKWVTKGDMQEGSKSSLQKVLTKLQTDAIVFVPSGMSERLPSTIRKNRYVQFIIVSNDTKERNRIVVSFQDYLNVKVSLTEDVKDTAIEALEKVIFKPMKHITETLVKLLESNEGQNAYEDTKTKCTTPRTYIRTHKNRKHVARKRLSREKGTTRKIGKTKNRASRNRRKEMSVFLFIDEYITRSKVQDNLAKVLEENFKNHRDSMERLLDEISGMYNRCRLPEHEIPRINESLTRNVGDEIAEELFAIDASVKSCGYRFGTLQVFADDPYNDEIKIKVKDVLRRNNINNYDIVPSIGSFEPLHKVPVGAKVHPNSDLDQYGSLCGFAKKNEIDLVALMSRHVAIHSPDRSVLLRHGHKQIRANIIPETLPTQHSADKILDISAAEIQPIDEEKCDKKFKSKAGKPTTGKQCSYEPRQLRSREVHIWGGTSTPGLGIITIPEIRDRDKDNTFIIVENRQNTNAAFSKKGDSGAMVCADDYDSEGVEVVSMLIGEDNDNPGKYATFRIDKGLEQLKRQTREDIHLCLD